MHLPIRASRLFTLVLLSVLAACSSYGPASRTSRLRLSPGRYYPPPGPPSDPWGPYIQEASARFSVPEGWIRAVMRQESAGEEQALSPAGAIGLMQVMPATYADLQSRYSLGFDPWEPHDNIMAGTAYIREMYDRFGSPGFLAAYNAGPGRVDSYLSGGQPLPAETVSYVASIAPRLGGSTGPVYPSAAPVAVAARQPTPQGCDLDVAYDPSRPCAPAPVVVAAAEPPPPQYPAPGVLYHPMSPPVRYTSLPVQVSAPSGAWAVQVGAFSSPAAARQAAANARNALPALLGAAPVAISTTEPFGSTVLFRARLTNLSATTAAAACTDLAGAQMPCLLVRPSGG